MAWCNQLKTYAPYIIQVHLFVFSVLILLPEPERVKIIGNKNKLLVDGHPDGSAKDTYCSHHPEPT